MHFVNSVQAFLTRNLSSTYKNEVIKLKKISLQKTSAFEDLSKEVSIQKGSQAGLLAIQDFAYQVCKDRIEALKNGKKIELLNGEKPVGTENCLLGQAECMKEIYIQTKNLRHGNEPDYGNNQLNYGSEASLTFQQLNALGYLSKNILPSEDLFNRCSLSMQEATFSCFRKKLNEWINSYSDKLHTENKTIGLDSLIKNARTLGDGLKGYFEEEETSGQSIIKTWVPGSYRELEKVHDFLQQNANIIEGF